MSKFLYWFEKLLYIGIAFVAIIAIYSLFKIWSEGKLHYFLFVGDLESAAIVFVLVFAIGFAFKNLWKWEIHEVFKPRQPPSERRTRRG